MPSERIDQRLEEAVTEGRAEGQRQGRLGGQRKALREIAEQRFDGAKAAASSSRLAGVDDAAELIVAGALAAAGETGDEPLRRLDAH